MIRLRLMKMTCDMLKRHLASRAEIQKSLEAVKSTSLNRSSQITKLHKMLNDFERSGENVDEKNRKENYEVSSMMGEIMLRKDENFEKVEKKRAKNVEKSIENREIGENSRLFPFKKTEKIEKSATTTATATATKQMKNEETQRNDRGFFIESDVYVDEYIAGNSMDLDPGDEMVSSCQYYGRDDAVEQISFQLPGQRVGNKNDEHDENEAEIENLMMTTTTTGTIIEEMAASKKTCTGCGANFHCKDGSLPGFVPLEIFEKIEQEKYQKVSSLCKRCHLLQEHNFLLNVNVAPVDYESMMSELKKEPEALILLIVDVTDLPGSIHPNLGSIIGKRRPMIVIGNKVDLLPPDARTGYMYRFKKTVERAIEKAGMLEQFQILHTALVSAKTGYGVEDLITEIYMKYTNLKMAMRGNIYLIGCTNAGKSTMFNAFLQSDLCKVRAVDLIDRATTSIWPGTTMSLLKFPVMKPSPYKLEMRRRRLMTHRAWLKKERLAQRRLLNETGDDRFAIPTETIQNTFKETEDELQPLALKTIVEGEQEEKSKNWNLDDSIFKNGKWCYDTPGTINENQVISLFTLDELMNALPRKVLKPRTALIKCGETLLIGGIGRVDIVEAEGNVLLTTFVNEKLPLNVMEIDEASKFLEKWQKNGGLIVPSGDEQRMKQWQGLGEGRQFELKGRRDEGCADIVLSSIGWVMISSEKDVKIRAFAPENRGITARIQAILPSAAKLRGKRIAGSRFYKVLPIEFPVNLKRRKKSTKFH